MLGGVSKCHLGRVWNKAIVYVPCAVMLYNILVSISIIKFHCGTLRNLMRTRLLLHYRVSLLHWPLMVPVPAGQKNRRCLCTLSGRSSNSHLMRKREKWSCYYSQCVNTLSVASSNKQRQILQPSSGGILHVPRTRINSYASGWDVCDVRVRCVGLCMCRWTVQHFLNPLNQHLISSLCPIIVSQAWRGRWCSGEDQRDCCIMKRCSEQALLCKSPLAQSITNTLHHRHLIKRGVVQTALEWNF